MGRLTEPEIFDCLVENLRLAAEHSDEMAINPRKGPIYRQFRDELKLVEGACRQAAAWRTDSRWYPLGLMMEQAHQYAGEWLRGVVDPVTGRRRPIPEGQKHPLFVKLAEKLREFLKAVENLRNRRTGIAGAVLPVPVNLGRREGSPVSVILPPGMNRTKAGLIVPDGIAAQ